MVKKFGLFFFLLLLIVFSFRFATGFSETLSPPPIEEFAQPADIKNVLLSPNGEHIALMRRIKDGNQYIIEIRQISNLRSKPVIIGSKKMEIMNFQWINNNRILIAFRQLVKARNSTYWATRYASIDKQAKKWVNLPEYSSIATLLPKDPNQIIIKHSKKGDQLRHFYLFNIKTGALKQIYKTNTRFFDYEIDQNGKVRIAYRYNEDKNKIESYILNAKGEWEMLNDGGSLLARKTFSPIGFFNEQNPDELLILAHKDEPTAGAYLYNIKTKQYKKLFSHPKVDVSILTFPVYGKLEKIVGITYNYDLRNIHYLDEAFKMLHTSIDKALPGKVNHITSMTKDGSLATILSTSTTDPGSYFLLKDKSKLIRLGVKKPNLKPEMLGNSKLITYKARDGLEIPAILTLPPKGRKPYPTIIMPHGGPWARDYIGYDKWLQLLASHNYAILQPQYRGSTGFTQKLWISGDREWGQKMQDDKDDGALYLIKQGIADKNRIAMFGWSYGGYAGFVASIRPNGIYQCSVAGAGVSDLNKIRAGLSDNPIYRKIQWKTITGLSPIDHVKEVSIPILVIHGNIDRRVPVSHSRQFVKKLKQYNKPHHYVELKNADHFYGTIPYKQSLIYYKTLLDWLDNTCKMKP